MSTYFDRGRSKINGGVTEVALMTPIKRGRVPGERRTYEERLRSVLSSIQGRAAQGILTEVNQIPTIHFARWIVVRPENYLLYSSQNPAPNCESKDGEKMKTTSDENNIIFDEFKEEILIDDDKPSPPTIISDKNDYRTWLYTMILFDGDVKVYGREIASFIQKDVDLIFENCENYPYAENFPAWWDWFRRYQLNSDVFYNAYPGLTVTRIKELELFKAKFDAFVAKVRPHGRSPIEPVDALLDDFIRETQTIEADFPSIGGAYKDPHCDND